MASPLSSASEKSKNPGPLSIRKLGFLEIPRAVGLGARAFEQDPFEHYLRDTKDSNSVGWSIKRPLEITCRLIGYVYQGNAWAIGSNLDAVVAYTPYVDPAVPRPLLSRLAEWLFLKIFIFCPWLVSKEQHKRMTEFRMKFRGAIKNALGDQVDEMPSLEMLATDPQKRGYGYGSALVTIFTAEADRQCRASWLLSSNIANTRFYNSLGFSTKAEVVLGDDNPDWDEPPVVLEMMVREPALLDQQLINAE